MDIMRQSACLDFIMVDRYAYLFIWTMMCQL